jgi:hypothetical protein
MPETLAYDIQRDACLCAEARMSVTQIMQGYGCHFGPLDTVEHRAAVRGLTAEPSAWAKTRFSSGVDP